jgi:hypothetical protein
MNETEDLACAFIEPVFQVLHAILGLSLQVPCMGSLSAFVLGPST